MFTPILGACSSDMSTKFIGQNVSSLVICTYHNVTLFTVCCYHLHLNPTQLYIIYTMHVASILELSLHYLWEKALQKMSRKSYCLYNATHDTFKHMYLLHNCKVSKKLTWYNVQGKWSIGTSVPICAVDCGSIAWGSCTKAQGWNQAILGSVIALNCCSKVPLRRWTLIVYCDLSKSFISPEKSSSLSSACEGDFLWGTSISSIDTLSQSDLI